MCLLIFFFKQWLFFWPLFREAQLSGVYGLKWSYGQIPQSLLWSFAAPSGLSLASLLPLWIMPSLPGLWVWWAALSWQVWCGAIFFTFFNNGFNGVPWDVQSFRYFFITHTDLYFSTTLSLTWLENSLVFMVLLAWWCPLLSGVADSVAFQNRCIYTEIMWQIMWHLDCTQVDFI